MLKKITNNLGLKIISAIFAVILWLVVVNIDNPITTKSFNHIKVNVINEDFIEGKGKTYKILDDTDYVNIEVEAKRTIIDELTNENFEAVADLEDITGLDGEQLVRITVSSLGNNSAIKITQASYNVKVNVEDEADKQFAINTTTVGTPADGYAVGNISVSPEKLKVEGPESVVTKIEKVVAEVDVSGMNASEEKTVSLKLYDSGGNAIDASELAFDYNEVTVNVEILETKKLTLEMNVEGDVAEGYRYTGMEYEPKEIAVKGSAEALQNLNSIPIPSSNLSIAGANQNVETVIDVSEHLPEGVQLVDEDASKVAVTLTIEALSSKTFKLPLKNIKIQNLANNLELEYTSNESVEIKVQGLASELETLTLSSIKGTIDLENKKAGSSIVDVQVTVPDGFSVVGAVTTTVKIVEKDETATNETTTGETDTTENNQNDTTDGNGQDTDSNNSGSSDNSTNNTDSSNGNSNDSTENTDTSNNSGSENTGTNN